MRLVECVPNFSEGRNRDVIDAIAAAISETEGAVLLDVDPGRDTNRTVITFVAHYEAAVEAAFRAVARAAELIDMSRHRGAHPRMGATDVCPFVPVSGVTMDDCVELARQLGRRVGEELGIPVYLYEFAATSDHRRNLADIRSGEYEGLAKKLKDPLWKPDFGPAEFNPKTGATVIGAREFLIAYNVNLNTRDRKIAHDIALTVREAGRAKRDENGKVVRDEHGKAVKVPGMLKAVKAVGWYIEEYKRAQVSMNLVNYHLTPPSTAFEEVKKEAEKRGVRVTGSELVGLIPLEAILQAGRYYLELQGKSTGVPEEDLIEVAVQSLGLNDISAFDPEQKIIEYRVAESRELAEGTVRSFVDRTSRDSPVPGGGSVSALVGSLACALTAMVANLTVGRKGYEGVQEEMKALAPQAQACKDKLLRAVDDDAAAFDKVMAAGGLPKKTDAEKKKREEELERATLEATEVPLNVLRTCLEALPLVERVADAGNVNSLSDAGVAALALLAASRGAFFNVAINLPGLKDRTAAGRIAEEARRLVDQLEDGCRQVVSSVEAKLSKPRQG